MEELKPLVERLVHEALAGRISRIDLNFPSGPHVVIIGYHVGLEREAKEAITPDPKRILTG